MKRACMHCGCEKSHGEWSNEKEGQLIVRLNVLEASSADVWWTDGTERHNWNISSTGWKQGSFCLILFVTNKPKQNWSESNTCESSILKRNNKTCGAGLWYQPVTKHTFKGELQFQWSILWKMWQKQTKYQVRMQPIVQVVLKRIQNTTAYHTCLSQAVVESNYTNINIWL